jgi:hypothetical protein
MMARTKEQWTTLAEFPMYELSNKGRIRNMEKGHYLTVNEKNTVKIVDGYGRECHRSVPKMILENF